MDAESLARFRTRLEAERKRWAEQIEHINDAGLGQSMSEAYEEMSLYDNHPADAGTEMFEREKDLGIRQNAQRMLEACKEALRRIDQGTYGICERCGQPIPVERLEAMPMATLCIACKSGEETLPDRFSRPVEEKVLTPPFGRSFRDGSTSVGYDGEDAWQDVGVYGTSEGPQDVPGAISYHDLYHSLEETYGQVDHMDLLVDENGEPIGDRDRPYWAGGRKGEVDATFPMDEPRDPLEGFRSEGEE